MNKNEYISRLEKALREHQAADVDEIMAEYTQHFDFKTDDGYTEEEVAARLAPPEEIAEQFAAVPQKKKRPAGRDGRWS